jgi:hypothetical protein
MKGMRKRDRGEFDGAMLHWNLAIALMMTQF